MLSSAILVVAALAVATSAGRLPDPDNILPAVKPLVDYGNANVFIDLFLFNINRQLPDSIYIGDIGGPFNMKDCYFLGTANGIKRDGDATLITIGNEMKFAMGLKMKEVGITCVWHYTLMSGDVSAITPVVSMAAGMILFVEHGQHPWLTQLTVTTMDPINVEMTGLVGLNWLAEDIANWVLKGAQDEITKVIETTLRATMQDILNTMVIP